MLAVGFLLLSLWVPSCTRTPPPALGVTRSSDGVPGLRFVPCSGERVHEVWVERWLEHPPPDEIVWAVHAPGGAELLDFTVGETPEGFVGDVRLARRLEPGERYTAYVETGSYERYWVDFETRELADGQFLTGDGARMTLDDLVEHRSCGEESVSAALGGLVALMLIGGMFGGVFMLGRVTGRARAQRLTAPPRPDR